MNFKTTIKQPFFERKIKIEDSSFFIGSCFSINLFQKFQQHFLRASANPFGTVFNPVSIKSQIEELFNYSNPTVSLTKVENRFYSLNHNSLFSEDSKIELEGKILSTIKNEYQNLTKANNVFITLGTAWVYQWKVNQKIVANCHKIPQNNFTKKLLSIQEISETLQEIISLLQSNNPAINVVFTLSPVRHLKDGFTENSLSKARLLESIHQVVNSNNSVEYFPAFEIFMDDLRDYRFYDSDMVHPNDIGVEYVWEIFKKAFFTNEALAALKNLESLYKAQNHRLIHPNPIQQEKHNLFVNQLSTELKNKYPKLTI